MCSTPNVPHHHRLACSLAFLLLAMALIALSSHFLVDAFSTHLPGFEAPAGSDTTLHAGFLLPAVHITWAAASLVSIAVVAGALPLSWHFRPPVRPPISA